jgi:hypothetical protein
MTSLLAAVLLLQAGDDEAVPHADIRFAIQAGAVFLRCDEALGTESDIFAGEEVSFRVSKFEPDHSLGLRAYYRQWDLEFNEFDQLPADLDGEFRIVGLELVITYPLAGPLSLGLELGGGAAWIEHDLDDETAGFFSGGAFLRVDLVAGLYLEGGGGALSAFTDFGGQSDDSDHISWMGRISAGLELSF